MTMAMIVCNTSYYFIYYNVVVNTFCISYIIDLYTRMQSQEFRESLRKEHLHVSDKDVNWFIH